jgi:hypothetical protein
MNRPNASFGLNRSHISKVLFYLIVALGGTKVGSHPGALLAAARVRSQTKR